ncbi:MAG: acyltransferase [Alphaproteobacteria bacterium]
MGVRIGTGCRIYTQHFSTEPYLVRIGDRVGIAGGVKFLTHDGAAALLRRHGRRPGIQAFGTIEIGDDVFVGEDVILLPGTVIGAGSIVVAGSVVRGRIAPNSLVAGNPATVIGRASLYLARLERSPDALDTLSLPERERRAVLERHFFGEERP